MCGFAGIFLIRASVPEPELRARITAMAACIAHRGPDAQNVLLTRHAGVGFRRLAIVDLQTGDQPVSNQDGSIQVFFNGEIYNHLDLRARLRADHGIDIRQGSDAAVLPHLYEKYGATFADMCNGMFAICVLDHRTRTLRLYRDPIGVKPLYFAATPDTVVFGSELKALFASGLLPRAVDPAQLVPFLELFYVPGRATIAAGVNKVLPGECLVLARGLPPRCERWHQGPEPQTGLAPRDHRAVLDATLAAAVKSQLMADVPVGISLSGGLDSSLIACYARQADSRVRAYTIHFPDSDPGEQQNARRVAQALGIEHKEIAATEGDFIEELDNTTWFNDEPVADPAFYSAMLVARAAAKHVKVLLAGSGADELFGGYGHHTLSPRARLFCWLRRWLGTGPAAKATRLRPERVALLGTYHRDRLPYHAAAMTHLTPADRQALAPLVRLDHLQEMAAAFESVRWMDGRNQQLYVDTVSYLPHQLLSLLDRTTMAASIEGRVPFLDRGVVAAAFRIHGRHKYRGRYGNKWLLRQLAAAHLPPGTVQRRKLGFPNSVAKWLAPDRLLAIRDRLWARGSFIAAAFPGAWLSQLLASADALQHNALTVHSLLVLEAWQRRFVAPARFEVRQELAYTVHPL